MQITHSYECQLMQWFHNSTKIVYEPITEVLYINPKNDCTYFTVVGTGHLLQTSYF